MSGPNISKIRKKIKYWLRKQEPANSEVLHSSEFQSIIGGLS